MSWSSWQGNGNIDANPLFVDLINGDYHLQPGSPCIDAGDNDAVPFDVTTDRDGKPRFSDVPLTPDTGKGLPPIVDFGAYEYQGITNLIIGDFCGVNFGPPDGYVDVWDLMVFADQWHTLTSDSNWDSKFDLAGPNFSVPDGYIDVWDLMVFADHWHKGVKPQSVTGQIAEANYSPEISIVSADSSVIVKNGTSPVVKDRVLPKDIGTRSADTLTNIETTTQPILTFSENVYSEGNDVRIFKTNSNLVIADSISNWGNNTMRIEFNTPLILDGEYTVTLNLKRIIKDETSKPINGRLDHVVHCIIDLTTHTGTVDTLLTSDNTSESLLLMLPILRERLRLLLTAIPN